MKRVAWMLAVALVGGSGCGKQLDCGAGTVEQNGHCVPATPVSGCGDGGVVIGGVCYPGDLSPVCGANTVYDPVMHKCVGTGTGAACSSSCEAPSSQTVCITGTAKFFIDGTLVGRTETSQAMVRVYDPIAFATGGTTPIGMANIEDQGCYIAHGVPRPLSNLIAVAIDDVDQAADATYATMGAGAPLEANNNVNGLTAYALKKTEAMMWQTNAAPPAGCTSLLGCGMWLGHYLDQSRMPVGNVKPTRGPGDDPAPANVYCFRGDRANLTTMDVTDTATGLCAVVPDVVEPHAGSCAGGAGTCMCGATSCSLTWDFVTAGTAAGVAFYQPMLGH